jgi:hypothetical protein
MIGERITGYPLNAQPDLFRSDRPDEDWQPAKFGGDPDRVRLRLRKILDLVHAADALSSADLRCYRTIFPQMVNWLPKDEAAEFLRTFNAAVKRLEAD